MPFNKYLVQFVACVAVGAALDSPFVLGLSAAFLVLAFWERADHV